MFSYIAEFPSTGTENEPCSSISDNTFGFVKEIIPECHQNACKTRATVLLQQVVFFLEKRLELISKVDDYSTLSGNRCGNSITLHLA